MNRKMEKIKEFNELQEKHVSASKRFILSAIITWIFFGIAYFLQNLPTIANAMFILGLFCLIVIAPIMGGKAFYYSWKFHKWKLSE